MILLLLAWAHASVILGTNAEIASLNPFTLTGIEAYTYTGYVIEPLARPNPFTKELEPVLAESWKVDGRVLSVRLKAAKFHDGSPLEAEDVKFTLEAYFDESRHGEIWRGLWQDVEKVSVKDKRTVLFHLKERKYEVVKNVLTMLRILPRTYKDRLIGTGAFRVKALEPGRHLDLEGTFPLRIKTVRDSKLAQEMYAKGELDFYALPRKVKGAKAFESATGTGFWIDLNLRHKPFDEVKIREALTLLWNRQSLNQKILDGEAEVSADGFSPRMSFYPAGEPLPYDPKRAARILREAGFKDSNRDGILERNAKPLSFTIYVRNPESERWLTLYQSDAAKIGVKVHLKRVDGNVQWWKLLRERKFEAVAGEGPVSDEVFWASWHSTGKYNYYGYANPKLDKLFVELESEFDHKKRSSLQRQMIEILRADRPQIAGLFLRREYFLVSPRLEVDLERPTRADLWRLKH